VIKSIPPPLPPPPPEPVVPSPYQSENVFFWEKESKNLTSHEQHPLLPNPKR
jgi:hypothetical protein